MKQNSIALTTLHNEPEIEKLLESMDASLKAEVQRTARHYAAENRPAPSGESLVSFVAPIKSGYERCATDMLRLLQPESHLPEGKADIDHKKKKEATLDWEIEELEKEIAKDKPLLEGFDHTEFDLTRRKIIWVLIGMMAGETVYNASSFQKISENLLFALLFSCTVTAAVILGGHTAASLYKQAKNRRERIAIAVLSFVFMSILFYGFAYLRVLFLKDQHQEINPLVFVLFNLFFFIVMCLISHEALPTWRELRVGRRLHKIYLAVEKKMTLLKHKKAVKEEISDSLHVLNKARVRSMHFAKYVIDCIKARYREAVGLFMATNNRYRTDHKTPNCFSEIVPDLIIDDSFYKVLMDHRK